jgi:lysyl-tRNA synthetase class 2
MSMELNEHMRMRLARLDKLETQGVSGFPNDFRPDHSVVDLRAAFEAKTKEELEAQPSTVAVAGRVMTLRNMGKAAFFHLKDREGIIQVFVSKDRLGDEAFEVFKLLEPGDLVGVTGAMMRTRTGELSVGAQSVKLLTKSLRPLPEKWHGLQNLETRFRQRYVDLIVNDEVRAVFRQRSQVVSYIRAFLDGRGFLEVETPMMHPLAGGAAARPFITHHNALDIDLFLRIAPELYLKRLLVGGLERVYEINRNFRNEGLSTRHNPEFTMLEFYWAYADYRMLMDLTEEMVCGLVTKLHGTTVIPYGEGTLDLGAPWQRLTMKQAVMKYAGLTEVEASSRETLFQWLQRAGVKTDQSWGWGKALSEVYEQSVEANITSPTFITHHPVEISPLARRNQEDPELTDRFELVIAGREVANAFSELNDPRDQRSRFESQLKAKEAGDAEAHEMDLDYLRALEFGMPPAAGEGIGIDRLVMLLCNRQNIKEVILFPTMRPEDGNVDDLDEGTEEPPCEPEA